MMPKEFKKYLGEMTIFEHIQELRTSLIKSLGFLIFFSLIAMCFMQEIISFLQTPYHKAIEKVAKVIGTNKLTAINVFEVMTVNIKVCFLVGFIFGLPFILWEIWKFVSPALYPREKSIAVTFLGASIILFYLGIYCGYSFIIPLFFENALVWASQYAHVTITFENYFNTLITMVMIFGIIFEVPVILSLLGALGILPAATLKKYRRILFLASFIIGAILAPPDVLSMCLIALPLYAMIEISIFIIDKIKKPVPQ
ncbi:MAG: twin-arginine translocase subunit TatC [Silvanigrellaceae bacterium]|nr:twin-arginine translocase subunit TatC [Silvanigrellaceae bacterium]